MSYASQRARGPRVNRNLLVRRQQPMGGVADFFKDAWNNLPSVFDIRDDKCFNMVKANSGDLDGQLAEVEGWDPNGFYTVDQMAQLISFTFKVTEPVMEAARKALNQMNLPQHVSRLTDAADDVSRAVGIGGLGVDPMAPFAVGLEQARAEGAEVIEAQGLKAFVVNVFKAVHRATKELRVVECARPHLLFAILAKADEARDAVISVIRAIGAGIIAVGQVVAKIPNTIGNIFTVLKWGAIVGGLYFIGIKTGVVPPEYDVTKRLGG